MSINTEKEATMNIKSLSLFLIIMCNTLHACTFDDSVLIKKTCFACTDLDVGLSTFTQEATAQAITHNKKNFIEGQLALMNIDQDLWVYVIIWHHVPDDQKIYVHMMHNHQRLLVPITSLRMLKPFYQWIKQPKPPRDAMQLVLKKFLRHHVKSYTNPYIQLQIIPLDSIIHVIGDLHGSIESLTTAIEKLHRDYIINDYGQLVPNHYLVLLGDYADRGHCSAQVWQLLMTLKENKNVILLAGNHETLDMAEDFLSEWRTYFTFDMKLLDQIRLLDKLFLSLPQALLLAVPSVPHTSYIPKFKFLLFCHGGIDPTVPFERAILKTIATYKKTGKSELLDHQFSSRAICPGLLWSDFFANIFSEQEPQSYDSPRGFGIQTYNSSAAREFMEKLQSNHPEHRYSLDAILRGHQHISGGITRLRSTQKYGTDWKPLLTDFPYTITKPTVFTCTSSPEGLGIGTLCCEDAMATIEYRDQSWQITPFIRVRQPVQP